MRPARSSSGDRGGAREDPGVPGRGGLSRRLSIAALLTWTCACITPDAVRPPVRSAGGTGSVLVETAAPKNAGDEEDRRRDLMKSFAGIDQPLKQLYGADSQDGQFAAAEAFTAYGLGQNMKALLLAQAAVGADPGNPARRALLRGITERTGIPSDPEDLLPLPALTHRLESKVEQAFFDGRFGTSLQDCRKVILLQPDSSPAWARLGSIHFALGDAPRARRAYARALKIDPENSEVLSFMKRQGWILEGNDPRRSPGK